MLRILFLVFVMGVSVSAWAERYKPIIKSIGLVEKIVVRGFDGTLQIVPTESETLRVEAEKKAGSDGWNFEVRQKQDVMEIQVKNSSEQAGWEELRSGENLPNFDMKITAPLRPMEIFWNKGQVFAEGWRAGLSLQMTEGKTQFSKGEGPLKIQLINGRVEVVEHQGNLALQTFKGQILLKKTKGALVISNHSALLTMDEHEGPLEYRNHSGTSNLKKIKGNATIRNVSGTVRVREFEGSLQGEFSKGALDAQMISLQNLSVNSDEAAITLDAPKESGASVRLRSEKGRLWAPIHLQKIKKGLWTERKGRLKGKEPGDIKIVSKYGDIVLK